MAVAATLVAIPGVFKYGRIYKAFYSAVFSGSYSTGGDTCDLRGKLPGNRVPLMVKATGVAGFVYQYVKGANLGAGKLMIRCNTAGASNGALAEHTAAAVDAAVLADTIVLEVEYPAL